MVGQGFSLPSHYKSHPRVSDECAVCVWLVMSESGGAFRHTACATCRTGPYKPPFYSALSQSGISAGFRHCACAAMFSLSLVQTSGLEVVAGLKLFADAPPAILGRSIALLLIHDQHGMPQPYAPGSAALAALMQHPSGPAVRLAVLRPCWHAPGMAAGQEAKVGHTAALHAALPPHCLHLQPMLSHTYLKPYCLQLLPGNRLFLVCDRAHDNEPAVSLDHLHVSLTVGDPCCPHCQWPGAHVLACWA